MLHPSLIRKRGGWQGIIQPTWTLFRGFLGLRLGLLGLLGLLLRLFLGLLYLLFLLLCGLLFFVLHLLAVILAQELLNLAISGLDLIKGLFDGLEGDFCIRLVDGACLVLAGAEVLDLLAAVLDLDQAQCGG